MRPRRATLASVGEFPFLNRLVRDLARVPGSGDLIIGPGDDCAVVHQRGRQSLLTIDALVEGVHFESSWMTARQIGHKAFAVNASDIAAMGGKPRWVLVALNAPATWPADALHEVQRGIASAARQVGAAVVGGNLTRADRLAVTIALIGEIIDPPLTRAGARPGDAIFVTGTVGDSGLGLRILMKKLPPNATLVRRFLRPEPRLHVGQQLAHARLASASIDISDGLLQDLGHLCTASGVGARIDSTALPLSRAYRRICGDDPTAALGSGEDYELLFTVPAAKLAKLERHRPRFDCPITQIGTVVRGATVTVDGQPATAFGRGFDHFRRRQEASATMILNNS